ncbi:MAG: hypothetical protein PHW87_07955 [Methanothrix sp.]|nr:hypothetical protein [Methanothrix sp.]
MADAISIPTQIEFKEMLSHTFPGFFLAFSIFMLIDYLSPDNFSNWAMGSLTGLVSFAGFIIIMGTILGVIIDGIHHTFIEDDIFDNFEAIHQLKKPIEEQLKANCHEYSDNLSRHFFLSKIGEKGASANVFENLLDQAYYRYSEFYSNIFVSLIIFSIISPFYAFEVLEMPWRISVLIGIASLLTACLCLVSSYTTYKIYLQAQSSTICGFIKDAKSECTKCTNKCNNESHEKLENTVLSKLLRYIIIFLIFLIPIGIVYYFLMDIIMAISKMDFFIALIVCFSIDYFLIGRYIFQEKNDKRLEDISKYVQQWDNSKKFWENLSHDYYWKNEEWIAKAKEEIEHIDDLKESAVELKTKLEKLEKSKGKPRTLIKELLKSLSSEMVSVISSLLHGISSFDLRKELSKSASGAMFSFISSLFACMIVLAFTYTPINLNVEPTCIKFTEDLTNQTSIKEPVETLFLKNLGRELNATTLSVNGIEKDWLEINYLNNNMQIKNEENKVTINNITSGETKFAQVKLNSSNMYKENISKGSYIGSIDIYYSKDSRFRQMFWGDNFEKHPDASIPVYINLTKK